jgi:PPOX class probable F420-dependent enzyme
MTPEEARARFAAARVARLATAGPHVVPICFAVAGDVIWSAVDDAKAKRTRSLKRLRNIAEDPRVSLVADHYEEDWSRLWWARADGTARVIDDAPDALALLCERYEQYAAAPPPGPFVEITVTRWSGWAAS